LSGSSASDATWIHSWPKLNPHKSNTNHQQKNALKPPLKTKTDRWREREIRLWNLQQWTAA